jgi:hypothetical protein
MLMEKGVLTPAEYNGLLNELGADRVGGLIALLHDKGVLTAADVSILDRGSLSSESAAKVVPAVYPPPAAVAPPSDAAPAPQPGNATQHSSDPAPGFITAGGFRATLYGTALVNAFFDTSLTNNEDIPLFAGKQGSGTQGSDKSFAMTARQSRFGLRLQGPDVMGAKVSGQVEVDFFGGKAALSNGIDMDLLRLRIALGRLDWTNFSLVAGQDWSIFAPLNPTSLASYAIPAMSASGNPWIRQPQIRAEFRNSLDGSSKLLWQLAATDPDVGDYTTTTFLTSRSPGIGERGRMPGIDSRLAYTTTADDRDFTFGLSGHYNRGENAGTSTTEGLDSWGVAGDWSLPFTKYFNVTGETYSGRALGIFSVASGESVLPVGGLGARGVFSRGGWLQAQFNMSSQWQLNLAYGIDAPRATDLPVGDRDRNQTYMGNVMYKFSPNITFALEYRRFLTDFRNQLLADERGDHVNLAIAYFF